MLGSLQFKAMFAGLLWGLYPLLLNKSGLNAWMTSVIYAGLCFVFVAPFAVGAGSPAGANWLMVLSAAAIGSIGLLFFNGMLTKATSQEVGPLCVLMVVAQIVVPAIHHIFKSGEFSWQKALGFMFAILAAIFVAK